MENIIKQQINTFQINAYQCTDIQMLFSFAKTQFNFSFLIGKSKCVLEKIQYIKFLTQREMLKIKKHVKQGGREYVYFH